MNKIDIKRYIEQQNPTADFNYERDGFKSYSTEIIVDGFEEIIEFKVPIKECDFSETVLAELLIKWIV